MTLRQRLIKDGSWSAIVGLIVGATMLQAFGEPASGAGNAWRQVYSLETPGGQNLRGYGRVSTVRSAYVSNAQPSGRVWVQIFQCATPEKAQTLIGKFLADLNLSAGYKTQTVPLGSGAGQATPVHVTSNGSVFVGCVEGTAGRVVGAENLAAMQAFAVGHETLFAGAEAAGQLDYPRYLDRFDRYGWGSYGVEGFDNPDGPDRKGNTRRSDNGEVKGVPGGIDPTEDVQFLIDHKIRSDLWIDPTEFDFGDGFMRNANLEWIIKQLTGAKQPFSFRVYGPPGGCNWQDRRFPEYVELPAAFLQSGWHGVGQFWRPQKHYSWFLPDIQRYIAANTMAHMKQFADNPYLTGWMHPQGELCHDPWYDMHDDYSPAAQHKWREFLRKQGVSLAEASRMYGQEDKPLGDWEQVTIPEFATFEGLNQQVASLEGTWLYRVDKQPGTALEQLPMKAGDWQSMRLPGNDELYGLFSSNRTGGNPDRALTWFRRGFTLTAAQASQPHVYLYFYPISHAAMHIGPKKRFHEIYVNGAKAGEIGRWGALDVTKLMQAGDNQIALRLRGSIWNGRIYLSTQAPRLFPDFSPDMNRLWLLWKQWHLDAKFNAWRDMLDGMRQVDPNRPIKFMAPSNMGTDNYLQLATNYGGFGHFTGEGMWFFPWYKRYGFLYDVPGSSETAGPPNNLADQFDSYRRVFLEGLNAHDPVFTIQWYTRNPELRKFWVDHEVVLKQLGRYDLDARQQVLLYRSTKNESGILQDPPYPPVGGAEARPEVQDPWNWDIGRGTLQTLGQSYLYLDDGGVADGKMNGYPLMIDSGNEIMAPETVRRIAAWVRAGGTFVTLPFTGRSTFTQPDSWPILELTGCQIGKLRATGAGKVAFAANNPVFQALAGKTFDDNGHCVDCGGGEHNLLSVELKPEKEAEEFQVLARFENGAPAIVRRSLGKGSVIVLGTAFWRDVKDISGLWKPGQSETDFLADLLRGLGFPATQCVTDDRLVWAQPYRYNNGLEASATLVSWHEDDDATVTLTMRLERKPTRLMIFGVDGMKELPFVWKDGVATAQVSMPAKEVKVVTADIFTPEEALTHWWKYQQRMWHELARPTIDFTPYTQGKFVDPTLDLRHDAKMLPTAPTGEDWLKPGFKDDVWNPCSLGLLNSYGAQPNQPVFVRKSFHVPAEWLNKGGRIYLTSGAWSGPHYLGAARLWLNGKMLHDYTKNSFQEFDVTNLLQNGAAAENVLAFAFKGENKYQGISGNVWLYYAEPAERSAAIGGVWQGTDDGKPATLILPGTGRIKMPTRTVFIPKEWEGRYQVRLYMEGKNDSILGAWINGNMQRRHHHSLGTRCDVDITSRLKFGQDNEFILLHHNDCNGMRLDDPRPSDWDIKTLRLDLYPVK